MVAEAEGEVRRRTVVVVVDDVAGVEEAWGRRRRGLAGGEEPAVAVAAEISMVGGRRGRVVCGCRQAIE
jgi:hypothetical protein